MAMGREQPATPVDMEAVEKQREEARMAAEEEARENVRGSSDSDTKARTDENAPLHHQDPGMQGQVTRRDDPSQQTEQKAQ